jgi:hypothetical protein
VGTVIKLPPGVDAGPIRVFTDASGAPAVMRCNGFSWAFDCLGKITCNLIGGSGSLVGFQVALDKASRAYAMVLADAVNADWIQRNATLYAEDES